MDIKLLMLSRGWLQYLSTYHYRGASVDYRAAMRRAVAHACGGFAANHYRCRAFDDGVRRTGTNTHIAHHGGRHLAYQYVWHTRTHYGTAHMRYRRGKRRGLHGAGVHVCYSCCWRHNFQIKSYILKIHFLIVH